MDHDTLVDLAREYFVQNTPIWNENPNLIIKSREGLDLSLAQYTGGIVQVGVLQRVRDSLDMGKNKIGAVYNDIES